MPLSNGNYEFGEGYTLGHLVRDLRAIYRPFGSTSSKSAKMCTYVHTSILFRFLPGAKSDAS